MKVNGNGSVQKHRGLRCRNCGCGHFRVVDTRPGLRHELSGAVSDGVRITTRDLFTFDPAHIEISFGGHGHRYLRIN